jgi:hypothetical protein
MAYKNPEDYIAYHKAYNAKRRVGRAPSARQVAMANGETHYITDKPCVHGHLAPRRVKDRVCSACDAMYQQKVRKADPIAHRAKKKVSYEQTKDHHLAQKKTYRQANKGKIRALNAARKMVVKVRFPEWLSKDDRWAIKEVYELAALRTKMFGFQWDVDHIVPLQGDLVSGLHVPWNMQVIPALDNIRKKNRFEVADA